MFSLFTKKPKKGSEVTFRISGLHCVSCCLNIDGALEETPGVLSASTHYARAETKVVYDPAITSEEKLKAVIVKTGYQVG